MSKQPEPLSVPSAAAVACSALVRRAVELFKCDTARISSPCGHHYLILGWTRNTKTEREAGRDCGQWYRNDEPIDFDYTHEQVIANGATLKELWKSAKHYKRLLDASTPNDRAQAQPPTATLERKADNQ